MVGEKGWTTKEEGPTIKTHTANTGSHDILVCLHDEDLHKEIPMKRIHEEGSHPIKAWLGMKEVEITSEKWPHKATVEVLDLEAAALQQLKNIARLPFILPQGLAVMPDAHLGKGATVGSVVPTVGAIIPAAVGVDIGCGMNAVRLSIKGSQLPDSLKSIRDAIEAAVPAGKGQHADGSDAQKLGYKYVYPKAGNVPAGTNLRWDTFGDNAYKKAASQIGTLGSGNHFIEICTDENDDVWVMLHSGSRGIGNMIGSFYIERAKKMMEAYYINLPDTDLAYIPDTTDEFKDYVEAVQWAQDYALENRKVMLVNVIDAIRKAMPGVPFELTSEAINCHHNYISRESHYGRNAWVTRKGAIRARAGDLGIIPGSMGQKSYIVRGKGNQESYCSCSHGAGRAMSRAEAKRRFSLVDLAEQTAGVECRKDADVIDEIPSSYKNLDVVMEHQKDLVEVVHTLKAHLCVKGN